MNAKCFEVINMLCELSDQQFDPIAKDKLKKMKFISDPEERRKRLLHVLDICVYGSLCSGGVKRDCIYFHV